MGLTHQVLGERLKAAREACGLTQEAVAQELGLSRPTLAQIEAGKRKVTGLELARLARLYARDITEFLADEFEPGGEPILLRALPEARTDPRIRTAVYEAMSLLREILALRKMLNVDGPGPGLPVYRVPRHGSRWHAVQLGNRLADSERRRLGLGFAPIPDLPSLVESQGALVLEMELPEGVSGFTLRSEGTVAFAVRAGEAVVRQRFSLAHEYCHALCDWEPGEGVAARGGRAIVCRSAEAEELGEVRANAFAAAFLLPEDGVRNFLANLGKGSPSRPLETVFAEGEQGPYPTVEGRLPPHSQEIGILELNLLADYFKVSRECAVWRLLNLRLLTENQRDEMLTLLRSGAWQAERPDEAPGPSLGATAPAAGPTADRRPLKLARRMLLRLALEALRREEISSGRFRELARQAGETDAVIEAMVAALTGSP